MSTSDPLAGTAAARRPEPRRSLLVCAVVGAAVMAAVDEIVFHQLLHWHHFYDRSTSGVALLSDGLLHTAELLALVAGFFLYADLRRRGALAPGHAWSGVFLGAGVFQVFDGIVDHKVLRVHQVRYGVDVTPYDWAWNLAGLLLLLVGGVLLARARRAGGRRPS
ncbi:DUF2243 domain-containing protein [Streptomyces cellulosae]|uniref:DUF2243 domain-containing protein n=2 Tax=Streptomyces TaxID=1883 RepID=A0ABU3JBE9_9ACTN|nr:DUF2243 domain-containing protein [Streptomyces sp. McG7]MBT2905433.1 DUF2243 domain-containing protein [Streptomyces sp. McG8]MDQ0487807.1 putative membrane protein [Streptomyces thermodiastaticus]MDT6971348.1 DUF2243 domain-containing protein [Streptomyces thermocarboxydus]MYW50426.1 DUF2243 domain-containing protein [Streptomyces sp. SID8376]THC58657.1 DUF2243 domain-containing protein [Streptomyces sp. Akac8]WSB45304.1 DUF2243 domain-containing protein [Streptomyces cellulosae]